MMVWNSAHSPRASAKLVSVFEMSGGLNDLDIGPVVAAVRDLIDEFVDGRSSAPAVGRDITAELLERLSPHPGNEPGDLSQVMDLLVAALEPGFDSAGTGFLSYIPTGALPVAGLGAYLGAVTNRYTGANHAAPGAVALEQSVIDWMIELFGLPTSAGGVLLSGGSIANLTATVAARSKFGEDFSAGVVYTSDLAHHSVEKAARIAGIASRRVRKISTDAHLRINCAALKHAIDQDKTNGLRPMLLVATAGTTDTGAIDPLEECAHLASESDCWFHVDAAYGGFFQMTERGRNLFQGIELADSITVDAHKSMFLPFGIGGLIVRETQTLVSAHEGHGSYMQDVGDNTLPHYYAMGPELTRPNRGLQMWLPLHVHGVDAFRSDLDRMLDLAEAAAEELKLIPGITVATAGPLSIVTFAADAGDAATRLILDHLNASGDVHVSSTMLGEQYVIRAAFLSQRTTASVTQRMVELVTEAVAHA
jgi:aromatic-L-amino-acid decarboxylase